MLPISRICKVLIAKASVLMTNTEGTPYHAPQESNGNHTQVKTPRLDLSFIALGVVGVLDNDSSIATSAIDSLKSNDNHVKNSGATAMQVRNALCQLASAPEMKIIVVDIRGDPNREVLVKDILMAAETLKRRISIIVHLDGLGVSAVEALSYAPRWKIVAFNDLNETVKTAVELSSSAMQKNDV